MRRLPRTHRPFLLALCLAAGGLLLPACAPEPVDYGTVLPADCLLWIKAQRLETIEDALERQGLMELLVAELEKPEVRAQIQDDWGVGLTDDPRADLHALLSRLRRLDVAMHPGPAEGLLALPQLSVCLEPVDHPSAVQFEAFLANLADTSLARGEATVHVLPAGDDALFVLRHADRLVAASSDSLLRALHARFQAPPDSGLVTTADYRRVRGEASHDLEVYAAAGLGKHPFWPLQGPQAAAMAGLGPALEKYGEQTTWAGVDYLLTEWVTRAAVPADRSLAALMAGPAVASELLDHLPADAYAAQSVALHEPVAKVRWMKKIYRDMQGAAPPGQARSPLAAAPFEALEAALGFTLEDLAGELAEVAIAGTREPRAVALLRARDAAAAGRVLGMLAASPALGFLVEGEPAIAGDDTLRTFTAPMDELGRVHAFGRRGDIVTLLLMADGPEALTGYLERRRVGATLRDAVPPLAAPHLGARASSWFVLDLARLAAAWDLDLAQVLAELPAPLAERLQTLVAAGHALAPEPGLTHTVMSVSGP